MDSGYDYSKDRYTTFASLASFAAKIGAKDLASIGHLGARMAVDLEVTKNRVWFLERKIDLDRNAGLDASILCAVGGFVVGFLAACVALIVT